DRKLLLRRDAKGRRRSRRIRHRAHLLHQVGAPRQPSQPRQAQPASRRKILRLPPRPDAPGSRRSPSRRSHLASPPQRRVGRRPPFPPSRRSFAHSIDPTQRFCFSVKNYASRRRTRIAPVTSKSSEISEQKPRPLHGIVPYRSCVFGSIEAVALIT